jgi:uncharacterized protein YuzE
MKRIDVGAPAGAVRMTYDPEADAMGVRFRASQSIRTKQLAPDHFADFDRRGRLVGLEVLHASRQYPRADLERLASPVELLTLPEAAKESGLSPTTLRGQIRAGRLPGVKRGRDWLVAGHELWNYLESRSPRGRPGARGKPTHRRRALAATG